MTQFNGLPTGSSHGFTVVKIEDLEITGKDAAGNALASWWYLATLPDGTQQKGQLDAQGHKKLERIPRGEVNVKITQDEPADPPPPPPPPPPAPPPTTPPAPGSGHASDDRTETTDDRLTPFTPPEAPPTTPDDNPPGGGTTPATPANTPPPGPKKKLVDVALLGLDEVEWEAVVMEITENRHGGTSGAPCPKGGKCGMGPCSTYFYSWCGDYASWVYWKAGCTDGTLLNRASLNGKWKVGENLAFVQRWGKAHGCYHERDGYVPSPGDFHFTDHIPSWHIGIVEKVEGSTVYTLDGKAFDTGWFSRPEMVAKISGKGKCQGVARTKRQLSGIRAFVDTRALREQMGYE